MRPAMAMQYVVCVRVIFTIVLLSRGPRAPLSLPLTLPLTLLPNNDAIFVQSDFLQCVYRIQFAEHLHIVSVF